MVAGEQVESGRLLVVIAPDETSRVSDPAGGGTDVLRIANCSGFYGDRMAAARELVEGGPIDVLTGDYLAELTMLILFKSRQRDPSLGYAATFYRQMEEVLGTCLDRGIKVVANAGGLNPAGLAERLPARSPGELGIDAAIAHVEGDDILGQLPRPAGRRPAPGPPRHRHTPRPRRPIR